MDTLATLRRALESHYELGDEIGRGGMAVVYLASDIKHGRRVAVKVLNPELASIIGPERFLAEIRITANLQHPNLLPLFDSGNADGVLYYVMPFVEGESLRARIDRERQLPLEDAMHIATAIALALDHAHRHEVVHRDLKPENILIHDGEPLLADFGIALALTHASGERLTQTGLSLGTPQYMSPEQAMGERGVDRRTDVYALGAVLYEMLTGSPPHDGATAQAIVAKILTETPQPVRSTRALVPPQVDAAIARALAKAPADRWSSAQAFANALTAVPTGSYVAPVETQPAVRASWRTLAPWIAGALFAGAALSAMILSRWRRNEELSYALTISLPDSAAVSTGTGAAGGEVTLSPDGRMIAYVAGPSNGGDITRGIWIRALDELTARPIRGLEHAARPRFSPDGTSLLFQEAGGVSRLQLQGGEIKRVTERGQSADWIDADNIVFTRGSDVMWPGRTGAELRRVRLGDTASTLVAGRDTARQIAGVGMPSVLPGGQYALVAIWKGTAAGMQRELAVVSLSNGEIAELGVPGSTPKYTQGHILFSREDGGLYAAPFSLGSRRIEGAAVQLTSQIVVKLTSEADYDVSRNGTIVYLAGSDFHRRLLTVDRAGRATPLGPAGRRYFFPHFSPDGGMIVAEVGTLHGFNLWGFDRTSRTLSALTVDGLSIRPSGWLDGGRKALFMVFDRSFGVEAATIDIARGEGTGTVLSAIHDVSSVSAGNGAIVFSTTKGALFLMTSERDTTPRLLVPASRGAGLQRLSADGRWVAYEGRADERAEIFVQAVADEAVHLQVSNGGGREPALTSSGDEVFYRADGYFMSAKLAHNPLRVVRRDTLFRDIYVTGALA